MNNKKQQILAFFIGLFTILIILEVGLRIAGSSYQKSRATPDQPLTNKQNNSFVILCLGNSFTLGSGAPAGESYPDQLRRMFNERTKGKNVTVINRGVGCENTAELLDKLEANINNTQPDLIILQTGQVNWVNFRKYSDYLKRTSKDKISFNRMFYSLHDFFCKSRVYKLLFLLNSNIDTKMRIEKSLDHSYRPVIGQMDSEMKMRAMDKDFFADEQKVSEAINLFKKGIEISPNYPTSYDYIGQIYLYQKNYDEALKWFMKAVMVNPNYRDNGENNRAYSDIKGMRNMAMDGQEEKIKKTIDKFIDEFKKNNPENADNFLFLSHDSIGRWAESDIIEIVKIIQSKKIKIILQNYPLCLITTQGGAKFINDILCNIAIRFKIPFVDNEKIFREIIDKGAKTEDYFILDGHCNSRGYKVMATNVYNKIIEEKYCT